MPELSIHIMHAKRNLDPKLQLKIFFLSAVTTYRRLFPDPKAMQIELKRTKRKLVTIVDPHVKREDGYWIHSEASSKGYYVKAADGKSEYKGQCWPGEVSYLDVTRTDVREWFQSQLSPSKYNGRYAIPFSSCATGHCTWQLNQKPHVARDAFTVILKSFSFGTT